MPTRPALPCTYPGCPELDCQKHRTRSKSERTANQRGYNYRWQQMRIWKLRQEPLCRECKRQGFIRRAVVVDHIQPHRGDEKLFWDQSNWQSLCLPCHASKSAREGEGKNPLSAHI